MLRFFGQGAMTHAGETTMARYFGSNRGKALSVATLGGMAGVMFLPYISLNYFTNIEMKQLWLYASISIIVFCIITLIIFFSTVSYNFDIISYNFKSYLIL